ncbi:SPFH domain / Band 7 family protein,putative [Schistosoma mansoni]|uniref:SPFH domain / Band 7 family protein,putative n=1 Tax=Schistosoma mansoni TaxID=6183 RepID=G4LZB3_SCHMA|nr:SPFH domain / Band 7 family protein,putative [Schistosoma mansoni]|eukprot:XP_018646588.1 SPFH domain / Band 7 family protein,putative [Schistosoma mansoni]
MSSTGNTSYSTSLYKETSNLDFNQGVEPRSQQQDTESNLSPYTCKTSDKTVTSESYNQELSQTSNEHNLNYDDVLTLHVPQLNENLWQKKHSYNLIKYDKCHCFEFITRKIRLNTSHKTQEGIMKKQSKPLSNRIHNGNHLNSLYENEVDIMMTSDDMKNVKQTEIPQETNDTPNDSEVVGKSMRWTTTFLAALSIFLILITFPFSLVYCIRIVAEYERAVVLRMGNLIPKGKGTKGPGLFFILPCIDSVRKVDLRTVTFAIPPQELLTRDSVTVSVDAVVYYRVLNPVASVLNIEDAARSTRLLAQTTIRNVLGTKDLAQILMDREEISTAMQSSLDATTDAWGVKVERIEIKDVRLPIQLQRAMAAEAEAAREARAKVIAAKGEQEAARSLKEAAKVISTSPMAFQLRYLQTLCAISAEKKSTIFFPVPIDIMQNIGNLSGSTFEQLLSKNNQKLQTKYSTNKIQSSKEIETKSHDCCDSMSNHKNCVCNENKSKIDKPTNTLHSVNYIAEQPWPQSNNINRQIQETSWAYESGDTHSDTV